jgi:ribokinase
MNKVIVVGSINMDIVVYVDRHPKIGESLIGNDVQYFPGGKGANQAIASSRLGAETTILGMVGQDDFGKKLVKFIGSQGVNNEISSTTKAPTGTALITVSIETANNTIVVIPGANQKLSEQEITKVRISKGDILVSQFEIPDSTIKFLFKKGRQAGTINILNPAPAKPVSKELLDLVDILILNESELETISGNNVNVDNDVSILNAVNSIRCVVHSIVVTLGEKGAFSIINGEQIRTDGIHVKAKDTTGAGDCFVGAVAASLANNFTLKEALAFSNLAASICVTKPGAGTSMPTFDELSSSINRPKR